MRYVFPLRIPDQLRSALLAKSKAMGVSVNALILQIIWEWMSQKVERR